MNFKVQFGTWFYIAECQTLILNCTVCHFVPLAGALLTCTLLEQRQTPAPCRALQGGHNLTAEQLDEGKLQAFVKIFKEG